MSDLQYVRGLGHLFKNMKEVQEVTKKEMSPAVRKGTNVIRDAARVKAPVYTGPVSQGHPPPGTLKRSIFTKYSNRNSSPSVVTYHVFVRQGKQFQQIRRNATSVGPMQATNRDAFYWRFVEFGTAHMTAKPFMRPAYESKWQVARDVVGTYIWYTIVTKVGK